MRKLCLLPAVVLLSAFCLAQSPSLPKGLTNYERSILGEFSFKKAGELTPPPTTTVRTAAEWEEVEYLVITWDPNYQNILRQIVQAAVNECKVVITTQNQASVSNYLQNNGVSLINVIFMNAAWNSIWIRDYAGNTVYSNDVGPRALTDWIYNRPRPMDDAMPSAHASNFGIPIYITNTGINDLVNTGGNFMSDGLGNAFASELILEENEPGNPYNVSAKTEAQIDGIMQNYMGISNYIKMPVLPYDGIHHIDMHMKLLDEETLLVSRYPPGIADGPQIEANLQYVLQNHMSPFGTPYKVHRIDSPPSTSGSYPDTGGYYRTFSNSVFINGTVLVPTYRAAVDTPALALYEQLLPGYNIVGIDVDNAGETLIASSGAIHCITHTIGVADPLWIVHNAIEESQANSAVEVTAMIKHASGIAQATVLYRNLGEASFTQAVMTPAGNDNFTIAIPVGTLDVEYYIWAQANSGKSLARPIVAPDGYWTINTQQLSTAEWALSHISMPFPNPARETVNFNLDRIDGPVEVTITNILGQTLQNSTLPSGSGTVSLPLLPSWQGTLLVTFSGDFGKVTRKIHKL